MDITKKYKTLLSNYQVNTPSRLAHFMAQIAHESNLKPVAENLNYSENGLRKTFRKYFTDLEAVQFQKKPAAIANRVYANRMGNGPEESGDGFKYRGRGFLQVTGKDNYTVLSRDTGIDYVSNPDLLLNEADAMVSALWYWNRNNLNALADKNNIRAITKKINGGYNGLSHRVALFKKYSKLYN